MIYKDGRSPKLVILLDALRKLFALAEFIAWSFVGSVVKLMLFSLVFSFAAMGFAVESMFPDEVSEIIASQHDAWEFSLSFLIFNAQIAVIGGVAYTVFKVLHVILGKQSSAQY